MNEQPRYRVLADYDVHDPHPLRLEAAEPVTVRKKDLGWPGWVWIEAGPQSGWIPEDCLEDPSALETVTVKAFDGTDLSARRGELLSVIAAAPGWIYAGNAAGRRGWFPLFNLAPFQQT